MTDRELQTLVQDTLRLTAEAYASDPALKGLRPKPLPPGSDEHIGSMAASIPAPIPPSYVAFLKIHDGCVDFWDKLTLLGTKGRPRKLIADRVKAALEVQAPEVLLAGGGSSVTPEAVAAFERQSEGELFYVPAYVVLGVRQDGSCLLFNHKKRDAQTEPEVVECGPDGRRKRRYDNFEAFLLSTHAELARLAKRDP